MNQCIFHQRRWTFMVLWALAAIIAGCGPTAGVGTGGTGSFTASIAGKVADGYLVNATVFLDRNGNYQWDAAEPFTTTGASGIYTLQVDPADVGNYPVVAMAIKGVTVDEDTGQAVANSYLLSLPKESVSGTLNSNFISPLTSQLRELMETGTYSTMQQAADALRAKMGLPVGTDLMVDYIVANNTELHTAAQNMATLMGNQMGQIFGTSGSAITVDVVRYRGMMGTIFTNMPSIMGSNVQTQMSNLNNMMSTVLPNVPQTRMGQPYQNMSSAFRGMLGGMNTRTGW